VLLSYRVAVGSDTLDHDCRHHWATSATKGGTDIAALQDAGGWANPVMPMRYVEALAVANERVTLWRREMEGDAE
jgi:hypothetical protein